MHCRQEITGNLGEKKSKIQEFMLFAFDNAEEINV